MTITRVGTNQKYATGWDSAFGKAKPAAAAKKDKKAETKKSPKKAAKKGKK